MIRFSIFRIPVEIQPFFWIILLLFGIIGVADPTDADGMLLLGLFVIAGALSIFIHELGHALTGKAFGAPTQITLHGFGGYATFPPGSFSRGQDFLVVAAGPGVQIILGVIALGVRNSGVLPTEALGSFFHFVALVSIFWAILNLVPVLPLDGGRLMAALLGPRRQRLTLQISMGAAVLVGLAGLTIGSFIIPIFLGMMAYENWKELQQTPR